MKFIFPLLFFIPFACFTQQDTLPTEYQYYYLVKEELSACKSKNNQLKCIDSLIQLNLKKPDYSGKVDRQKVYLNRLRKLAIYHFIGGEISGLRGKLEQSFAYFKQMESYLDTLHQHKDELEDLKAMAHYLQIDFCTKTYSTDTLAFNRCNCMQFFPSNPDNNSSQISQAVPATNKIIPVDSVKIKENKLKNEQLVKKQKEEKEAQERERITSIQKESDRLRQVHYNTFIYDSIGRLRIDSTRSVGLLESKQLKNNREFISASMISALNEYESHLYKEVMPKINYQVEQLLPYQIKDTTKHLYKISCDSTRIISIEHTLLSANIEYGLKADSMIQIALKSLFPFLKIQDGKIHEYYIPVIYIPFRYRQPGCIFYFCNCQFTNGLVNPILYGETCSNRYTNFKAFNHGVLTMIVFVVWTNFILLLRMENHLVLVLR